jgi:serine/threonine protein phosphatase 1
MTPLAVVGDVHGDIVRLRAMLLDLQRTDRTIVFVGDYVNGAPYSAEVLEELSRLAMREPDRYTFLSGNHDLALLRYLRDGDFAAFAAIGGVTTLHSYLNEVCGDVYPAFARVLPVSHRAFLERLEPYWERDGVLISHVGFDPANPNSRALETLVLGAGAPPFAATRFPCELVVCGHYVQSNGRPHRSEHLICIDTGCGVAGGPLTAVLLPEQEFISV